MVIQRTVSTTKDPIGIEGSIWFQKSQNRFLGGDRIALLEKIDELGSINSAAKAVGISYKTAWHVVHMMNNLSEKPLVDRMTGGKSGSATSGMANTPRSAGSGNVTGSPSSRFSTTRRKSRR
jgi:hypothetical protein